ncbi:MAG: methyltransferase domain-containing protein [Oscillatoriophycideae cyanobacterium NC_groundwater_1537_Pr4_S-0.65um_50_18]|nr:methyltransferase domain-containing protein [Oscillatoriophycideae cyanobacterium NC_groundwater_1537_Pr4_S-0.65um_50_18]
MSERTPDSNIDSTIDSAGGQGNNLSEADLLEKIRQQFDSQPYPNIPIGESPKRDVNALYVHNLITPFYLRNQALIDPREVAILDVGCGSGYKTLTLAEANPGATLVGIDLSEKSLELARQRLSYYGFTEAQFHQLPLDQIAQLGLKFDYINCDEVLYLVPDLVQTLQTLKSVMKPNGILRGNLHSLYQRQSFFRAQELFTLMGLMQGNPEEAEINTVLETMKAFKDGVPLKRETWQPRDAAHHPQQYVLMNFLFQGDQGYTIPELFAALREADLEFICMVNQRHWDLKDVFQDPQNLPEFWQKVMPHLSMEERLQLFELIAPVHRLLDFWCGQTGQTEAWQMPQSWSLSDWTTVQVHLHPQLCSAGVKADLIEAVEQQRSFDLSRHLSAPVTVPVSLSAYLAACLLPLWDAPQVFPKLVQRALKVRSRDPITLKPANPHQVSQELREALINLEQHLYVLLIR